jgi:indolepyruvate ferredoxin oxidoreductase beta subunit
LGRPAAFVFFLLTLGPSLRVAGHDLAVPLPFELVARLPFFKGNRYPSRYSVMLLACLAPLVAAGEVDVYLAFEKVEALRHLNQLRRGALAVINLHAIKPVTVTSGGQPYPDDARLMAAVAQATDRAVYVDGAALAAALGNVRTENVVLLGALSALMEREGLIGSELLPDEWVVQITARVPGRYAAVNRRAFEAGRAAASSS